MLQNIIEICEEFERSIEIGMADYDEESLIADFIKENPSQLEDLVKMYYKADLGLYKIRLADTLVLLNYKEIIPDLKNGLNQENLSYQYHTAFSLIELNEEDGALHLIKLHEQNPKIYTYRRLWCDTAEISRDSPTEVSEKYSAIFQKLYLMEKNISEEEQSNKQC